MTRFMWIFVVVGVATLGAAFLGGALIEDEREEQVTLDQIPPAVRAAILREAGDGIILEMVREIEDGQEIFEAEILVDGATVVEVEFAPDGRVLERETRGVDEDDDEDGDDEDDEDEGAERIPVGRIPAPALRTIEEYAAGQDFIASMERKHGLIVYEAEWEVGGLTTEVAVTADGTLLEIEEIVLEASVPPAVLRAADELFPPAAQRTYVRKLVVIYEVEAIVDGREREVLILPTGRCHDD
ncbi:MAG: hypothetical protein ACYTE6_02615 [Planctomycetota bacterium]|jgi:uncharacterized membrane protein YkoI